MELSLMSMVKVMHDSNYGNVNWVTVARINLGKFQTVEEWTAWDNKFHPKDFFGSFSFEIISDWEFILSLPLDSINLNWRDENPDCDYVQHLKKNKTRVAKTPPIGISLVKLTKWIEASEVCLTEVIDISKLG